MCKTCRALILQEGRQDPRGSESTLGFHSQERRLEHRATIDVVNLLEIETWGRSEGARGKCAAGGVIVEQTSVQQTIVTRLLRL